MPSPVNVQDTKQKWQWVLHIVLYQSMFPTTKDQELSPSMEGKNIRIQWDLLNYYYFSLPLEYVPGLETQN